MKLPKRVPQHISESNSFKLLGNKVPNNWIIRETTERDYGIDCYVELVNNNNELTGQIASIQLKSRETIPWDKNERYSIKINISTTNYWYYYAVPVFIFLADICEQEIYFLPVKKYIRQNFFEYQKQDNFIFSVRKDARFDKEKNLDEFIKHFWSELHRDQFENEILYFISNIKNVIHFQKVHKSLDSKSSIEESDNIFFETFYKNYERLCTYLFIKNELPSLFDFKRKKADYKKLWNIGYRYNSNDIDKLFDEINRLTIVILDKLHNITDKIENEYWSYKNSAIKTFLYYNKNITDFIK